MELVIADPVRSAKVALAGFVLFKLDWVAKTIARYVPGMCCKGLAPTLFLFPVLVCKARVNSTMSDAALCF